MSRQMMSRARRVELSQERGENGDNMNKLVKIAGREGRGDQRCSKEDKNAHWGEKTEMEWEINSDRRERERASYKDRNPSEDGGGYVGCGQIEVVRQVGSRLLK